MGCGVISCMNPSKPLQVVVASRLLRSLMADIKANSLLLPQALVRQFIGNIEQDIDFYLIKPKSTMVKASILTQPIKTKWKAILYGTDGQLQIYRKCIGEPQSPPSKCQSPSEIEKTAQLRAAQPEGNTEEQINSQKEQIQLLPHPCFTQIEKDLDRTFKMDAKQRQAFRNVLRRIANHFPAMGYTQGINFIVGFLLLMGFHENQSFWMFVHLGLNRRYMLLGLFEDQFPLSRVYTRIFKNILKRTLPQLHVHLYQNMQMDDSLWIFKWFMTCFLYNFPVEVCQYVLDVVLNIGGIGLVFFAIGIVTVLKEYLLEMNDPCDVSIFLQELSALETFNKHIPIDEVVRATYALNILLSDLQGIKEQPIEDEQNNHIAQSQNIYGQYLWSFYQKNLTRMAPTGIQYSNILQVLNRTTDEAYIINNNTRNDQLKLLQSWYTRLINERHQFVRNNGYPLLPANKIRISIPKKNILDKTDETQLNHNSNQLQLKPHYRTKTEQHNDQLNNLPFRKTITTMDPQQSNKLFQATITSNNAFSRQTTYGKNRKFQITHKFNQDIDELWDQQQENHSINEEEKFQSDILKMENKAQDDPFYQQFDKQEDLKVQGNNRRKRRGSKVSVMNFNNDNKGKDALKSENNIKVKTQKTQQEKNVVEIKIKQTHSIQNEDDILSRNLQVQKKMSQKGKYNHKKSNLQFQKTFNKVQNSNKNMLFMAGMNSLNISNTSNSNKSSASSKQNGNYRKQKENGMNNWSRDCKCPSKTKIDEHKYKNNRQASENGEQDLESLRNFKKQDQHKRCDQNKCKIRINNKIQEQQESIDMISNFKATERKRIGTYQEWMVNSHGPNPVINNNSNHQQIGTEIQLLGGGQLFKKKKQTSNRPNGTINHNVPSVKQDLNLKTQNNNLMNTNRNYNEDESCQSIFIPNFSESQNSRISKQPSNNHSGFDIESIK